MFDRLSSFLVALSLAFLVWLYARSRDQDAIDNVPIPVQITLAPSQSDHYDMEITGPSQVLVSFMGTPAAIRGLRSSLRHGDTHVDITLTVPPTHLAESRYLETVRIGSDDVPVPPGITAMVVEGRNRIPVTLRRLTERRLPVRFDHTEEDRVWQATAEPATVLVRGPKEILERVRVVPTQLFSLPVNSDEVQETTASARVALVRELGGRPIRPMPGFVTVRYRVRPTQRVFDVPNVPVHFLCPPAFSLRPRIKGNGPGRVTVRVVGPASEGAPAVTAYVDLTSRPFEPGVYAGEILRVQLPKDYEIAQENLRAPPFELVPLSGRPPSTPFWIGDL